MNRMKQFMRIATARLRPIYKHPAQRRAWAANMYRRWQERKSGSSTKK